MQEGWALKKRRPGGSQNPSEATSPHCKHTERSTVIIHTPSGCTLASPLVSLDRIPRVEPSASRVMA